MAMSKPTDQEFSSFPHVVLTSDSNWDPTLLDSEFDPEVEWQDAQEEDEIFDSHFEIQAIISIIMLLFLMLSALQSSNWTLMTWWIP